MHQLSIKSNRLEVRFEGDAGGEIWEGLLGLSHCQIHCSTLEVCHVVGRVTICKEEYGIVHLFKSGQTVHVKHLSLFVLLNVCSSSLLVHNSYAHDFLAFVSHINFSL